MGGTATRILSLLALVLVAVALGTGSARAVPAGFIGITAFEDPGSEELELIAEAGLRTYRSNLYWPAVEPLGPGARDWSRYDALIGAAAKRGIRVLPTIYGSPGWAAKKPEHPPDAEHRDDFGRFLAAAVARYGPGGGFWAEHPELDPLPIRAWQIWNEPNHSSFWLPGTRAADYASLLEEGAGAIRGVDPSAQIVLGGLFPTSSGGAATPMKRYLNDLYRAGAAPDFDAVAIHPYASDPSTAFQVVAEARRIVDRQGDAKKPIWITEIGWATSGQESGVTVSERTQADYLRETLGLAEAGRERLRLAGLIWFSLRDQAEPDLWPYRTGLFTADGEPKPAWGALVALAAGGGLTDAITGLLEVARRLAARLLEAAGGA